jgi:hypothetical protein
MRSALQWLLILVVVLNGPMASAVAHAAADESARHQAVADMAVASAAHQHCAGTSGPVEREQAPAPDMVHGADSCHGGTCHCGCAGLTAVPLPELAIVTDVVPSTIGSDYDASAPTGRVAAPFRPPSR